MVTDLLSISVDRSLASQPTTNADQCTAISRSERVLIAASFTMTALLHLVYAFRYRFDSDEPQHLHVVWGWTRGVIPCYNVDIMTIPSKEKQIFFHVGLAKTATTWLQHRVFPKFRGIYYVKNTRYHRYASIINQSQQLKYLVSREFDRQLEREVSRFAALYPQAHPIIVLRRHDSWIASQYRRRVKNGFGLPFESFFDLEQDQGYWKQSDLYFLPKLRVLEKYFSQKPLVLFYEDLKAEPIAFVHRIARYCGVEFDKNQISLNPFHTSYADKQLKVLRSVSRHLFSPVQEFSGPRVWRRLQKLSRSLVVYSILYPSLLLPEAWLPKGDLIPKDRLEKIRNQYAEDWQQCRDYAERINAL